MVNGDVEAGPGGLNGQNPTDAPGGAGYESRAAQDGDQSIRPNSKKLIPARTTMKAAMTPMATMSGLRMK